MDTPEIIKASLKTLLHDSPPGVLVLIIELRLSLVEHREREEPFGGYSITADVAQKLKDLGKPAEQALNKALSNGDERMKVAAALALGIAATRSSLETLLEAAFNDKHKYVREYASKALASLTDPNAVQPLIAALNQNKVVDRQRIILKALGSIGNPGVIDPLIALFNQNSSPHIRYEALSALPTQGRDPRVLNLLLLVLKGTNEDERLVAARKLVFWGDERVAVLIEVMEHDPSEQVRLEAACSLAQLRHQRAFEPLVAAYDQPVKTRFSDDYWLRRTIEALGVLGDQRAVELLATAAEGGHYSIRSAAQKSLAMLTASGRTAEEAISALSHPSASVRLPAANRLGELKDKQAVEPLVAALNGDNDDRVRIAAVEALTSLGGERAVRALAATLTSGTHFQVRLMAAEKLKELGDITALDALAQALRDEKVEVRRIAAAALAQLSDPQAAEPLKFALNDADEEVCKVATRGLASLGDDDAKIVSALADLRESDLTPTKINAVLQRNGVTDPLKALQDAASNPGRWIRWHSVQALSLLPDPGSFDVLVAALADADTTVQVFAVDGLRRLGDRRAVEPLTRMLDHQPVPFMKLSIEGALRELGHSR